MESLWTCRNNILHSNDSTLIERSRDTLTSRLLDFKRNSRLLLRSCDRYIIDNHSIQDVIKWPLQRKKAYADFLERLQKIYNGELKQENASYRDIREFFTVITKDTAPSALSDDTDNELEPQQGDTSTSSSEDTSDEASSVVPQRQRLRRCRLFESSSESSVDTSSDESPVLVQRQRLRRCRIFESSSESS
jgi:hypothetical protein